MKVLVAGATGALGTPLTRLLLSAGHQVVGLTRTPANATRLTYQGIHPIVADALDAEGLRTALRGVTADAVVHALTALKKPPMRHHDMESTDALREQGTTNLLAAARQVGASRFVAESMHLGYGFGDWGDQVLTESQPWAPSGHTPDLERHLAALRSLERQVFAATDQGGLDGISLRFGSFYGPGAGLETLVDMLRRRKLPLPGGGRRVMSWVYIDDAATAVLAALEHGQPAEAYNIVDDEPVALRDFVAAIADEFGTPRPRSVPVWLARTTAPYLATVLGETTMRVSAARAKAELGWTPSVPNYREGIARAAREQRAVAR
ncbi:MAG TPA: NAD(P)-dependent oxidoreductase [Mycobacteriales bacterium]